MPKTVSDWVKTVILLLIIGLIAFAYWQRQAIGDEIKLATYDPPQSISSLAADDTMTAKAQHLFYINHPELNNKASFRKNCPNGSEKTIILGCYKDDESGIFLLKVDDPRLNGVEQVTAAHEMLHAAYDRLSTSEKTKVDGWLKAYYKKLTDKRLIKIFNSYKKSEPGQLVNEMHSIFGTQVAKLPPKLANYYKQYFKDRSKVTAYAANYRSTFIKLEQQITRYDNQLKALKSKVKSDEASAEQQSAQLSARRAELNRLAAAGDAREYNSKTGSFDAAVDRYNELVREIKSDIATYNKIVNKRNKLAIAINGLGDELDASVQAVKPAS